VWALAPFNERKLLLRIPDKSEICLVPSFSWVLLTLAACDYSFTLADFKSYNKAITESTASEARAFMLSIEVNLEENAVVSASA
jgi:hypothetical protein